jgi:hypothetical protein
MNKADVLWHLGELGRIHHDQLVVLKLASAVVGTIDADRVRKLLTLVETNGYATAHTVRRRPKRKRLR